MDEDNRTIVSVIPEELDAFYRAAEERFGESNRISRGGMIRLLSEELVNE